MSQDARGATGVTPQGYRVPHGHAGVAHQRLTACIYTLGRGLRTGDAPGYGQIAHSSASWATTARSVTPSAAATVQPHRPPIRGRTRSDWYRRSRSRYAVTRAARLPSSP